MAGDALRIGLVAPPWTPVPPTGYGGTEAVVDGLARELQAMGHDVHLFTTGDATCPVARHWWHPRPPETMGNTVDELAHVSAAYEALVGCDVIHDHTTAGSAWSRAYASRAPVHVVTNHGEWTPAIKAVFRSYARHSAVVAISHDHARRADEVPISATIPHGIDVAARPFGRGDGGYVLFVGRMDPGKGADRAIRIARAAGLPLKIAAKMREAHERAYYTSTIVPLLGRGVSYLGEISPAHRDELLADAVALLNPVTWPEPFGMVMIEALATGTPVVALGSGSVPEIVEDGLTGFVCADEAAAARALQRVATIDRRVCRSAAETRFSVQRMARDHVDLYRRLLGERPAAAAPTVIDLSLGNRRGSLAPRDRVRYG